jgi:methylmalonyl-CoA mutase N-terminal domain/subunit
MALHHLDPAIEQGQRRRLEEVRRTRDRDAAARALADVEAAARGSSNLMPPILAAVKQRSTLGEISDVLRSVFGVYRPT